MALQKLKNDKFKEYQLIDFLVTVKGEIIPFGWIVRFGVQPFHTIDQFADTLTEPANPLNEMYGILENGDSCAFDLMNVEFTTHVCNLQYGTYLATDQVKRMLMVQFAHNNERMYEDGNQKRIKSYAEIESTV